MIYSLNVAIQRCPDIHIQNRRRLCVSHLRLIAIARSVVVVAHSNDRMCQYTTSPRVFFSPLPFIFLTLSLIYLSIYLPLTLYLCVCVSLTHHSFLSSWHDITTRHTGWSKQPKVVSAINSLVYLVCYYFMVDNVSPVQFSSAQHTAVLCRHQHITPNITTWNFVARS